MAIVASVVTVLTTPTLLVSGGPGANDLRTVLLRNDGAADIFIGGSTVATTTGLKVPTGGGTATIDLGPQDDLYGIVAAATQPIQVLRTRA